jgi:hypothetical protein
MPARRGFVAAKALGAPSQARCTPSRRRPVTARAATATALALLAALALPGCGGRKAAAATQPPEYPWQATVQGDFLASRDGLVPLSAAGGAAGGAAGNEAVASPLALRAAALSAPAPGGFILAALNRYGLGYVEPSPDGAAYKVRSLGLPEMGGQQVAGLWPRDARSDSFLLELSRDPFTAGLPPRSDFSPELLVIDGKGAATTLPRLGEEGEDLFALLPGPSGRWYAEFRAEAPLGARLRYVSLASPENRTSAADLRRDLFEAALAPRSLASGPMALREAVSALGLAAGQGLLIRAKDGAGGDAYWLSSGALEDATEAYAWLSADGDEAVVALRSGAAAWASSGAGGAAKAFAVRPALPGAEVSGIAALFAPHGAGAAPAGAAGAAGAAGSPAGGLAVVSWESGTFPSVSAAGISVLPLP